jgi:parvulin-like peptidyl-prolyl isomerase
VTQRARASGKSMPWAKLDPDHRNALLLYAGLGAIIIFALGIIGLGYYQSRVKPSHETVLTVGARKFDVAYLERRMKSQIITGQISSSGTFADLAASTVATIQQEEVQRQSVAALGIEVTDTDVDSAIKNAAGLFSGADQDTFASAYRGLLQRTGLPNSDYRDIMKAQVVQQKYAQQALTRLPDQAPQVKMHMIKVGTQAKADAAAQKLKGGTPFDNVAVSDSADPSKTSGGDLSWVAQGSLPKAVDDVAFSLPFGVSSAVIEAGGAFYIIQVDDRADNRDVDRTQKSLIARQSFDSVLNDVKSQAGGKTSLTEDQVAFIAKRIRGTVPSLPPVRPAIPQQPALPPPEQPAAPQPGG